MQSFETISTVDLEQLPSDLRPVLRKESERWTDLQWALQYHDRALFYGPPGTGKTRLATMSAKTPVDRVPVTYETCWAELRGNNDAAGRFHPGPVVRAWTEGKRLVVDEIDHAGGDTIPGLHLTADDRAVAAMTLPDGSVIKPAESFSFYATTNAKPETLPEALCDRFVFKAFVPTPDPKILLSLPRCLRPSAGYSLFAKSQAPGLGHLTTRFWVALGEVLDRHGLSVADSIKAFFPVDRDEARALSDAIAMASAKTSSNDY